MSRANWGLPRSIAPRPMSNSLISALIPCSAVLRFVMGAIMKPPRLPMILAPRMILSIEILQLSGRALRERIQHELAENPALAIVDTQPTLPHAETECGEPDAVVERAQGGDWDVRALDQWTGQVRLNDRYSHL